MSSQTPVNPPSGGSFYLGNPVSPGGGATQSLADQFYQEFFSADTISSGSVVTGQQTAQNAPVSATEYQASVQAAINSFIASVASATTGDVNFIANIVNNAIGSVVVPDTTAIQDQYNADSALVALQVPLVTAFDNYTQGQANTLSPQLTTDSTSIASDINAINTIASQAQTPGQQIAALLAQFNTDYSAQNYAAASSDIQAALQIYSSQVVDPYNSLNGDVSAYNGDVSSYYAANPLDPNYNQANWAYVQAQISARNSDTSITEFYGTLANLPNFTPLSPLANPISLSGTAPPDSSTFGFPSNVDGSTDTGAVTSAFDAMISAADAGTATAQQQASTANSGYTANAANLGNAPAPLNIPTLPSFTDYFQSVVQQIANLFTSSAFKELLAALGIQNNAASQAITAVLLSLESGSASILLSNPSGGAVTGATSDAVSNSAFIQAYASALQLELQRELMSGITHQSSSSIKTGSSQPADPNATPSAATAQGNSALQTPPADPGTTSAGGILTNLPLLMSDFGALLGQYAVLSAIGMLQSDTNLNSEDPAVVQAEFLSNVSTALNNISTEDLDNRLTTLFQSQGLTVSQDDLNAINSTVTQLKTSLQGIIANTLAGQADLATSTIGAQVASDYVKATFKEADVTNVRNRRQRDEDLLAALPQKAYLKGPGALAGDALSGGGTGPNGSLGLALSGVLPRDGNGNFTSVTPTQLYSGLVSVQGQATGSANFLQLVQNEPSYQLDEAINSNSNRAHAGHLGARLQLNQTTTLAANANKNFAASLAQRNAQFGSDATTNEGLLNLVANPTLAAYYQKKLLPGQNLLNLGLQVRKDQMLQTPESRNTTDFPV